MFVLCNSCNFRGCKNLPFALEGVNVSGSVITENLPYKRLVSNKSVKTYFFLHHDIGTVEQCLQRGSRHYNIGKCLSLLSYVFF